MKVLPVWWKLVQEENKCPCFYEGKAITLLIDLMAFLSLSQFRSEGKC